MNRHVAVKKQFALRTLFALCITMGIALGVNLLNAKGRVSKINLGWPYPLFQEAANAVNSPSVKYDNVGRLTSISNPTTKFTYDEDARLASTSDSGPPLRYSNVLLDVLFWSVVLTVVCVCSESIPRMKRSSQSA